MIIPIKEILNNIKYKIFDLYNKHPEIITICGLCIVCYFIFFCGIGTYSLMDVDETRYVAMARDMFNSKDYLTLYLNGEYFFEKPPLYFWQECISFAIWGKINEWSARFPVAILGFILSLLVYTTSRKRINRRFGVLTSLILATSLEFIILAKYAILDIVLTFYICLALVCYFQIYFCQENHKKFYWWAFYLFAGLAVMAKGIPGLAIPVGTVFFTSIMAKRFKEIFKPLYMVPGIIIFTLVVLPWHIIMLNKYNPLFFDEYIVKHHLHRFINTENNEIGRKQPFYYYFIILLWGFIPWIFSLISVGIYKIKHWNDFHYLQKIKNFNFDNLDTIHKLIALCWVAVIWIMFFFTSSTTKLATYILPVYYPLAIITGLMWQDYIDKKKHVSPINISAILFAITSTIIILATIFSYIFLPFQLNNDIAELKIFVIVLFSMLGINSLIFIKQKQYLGIFITYVTFMTIVSAYGTPKFFEVDYKFGQQDLIEFAQYAKEHDFTISVNGMDRKYSLLYYNDKPVDYNPSKADIQSISQDLKKKNNVVIVVNKYIPKIRKNLKYKVIKTGRKYTMIRGL